MIAIALDGPAGAGKSTVCQAVAKQLGIIHVDTGALYRAVGVYALRRGVDTADWPGVIALLPDIHVSLRFTGEGQRIYLDGEDVSQAIRQPEASMAASNVSAIPQVRDFLLDLQRDLARRGSVIMDGRDITTYVLQDAPYKFFITASPQVRAQRRLAQIRAQDPHTTVTLEEVTRAMEARDKAHACRAFAPLQQAADAVLVDTTYGSVEDDMKIILGTIRGR